MKEIEVHGCVGDWRVPRRCCPFCGCRESEEGILYCMLHDYEEDKQDDRVPTDGSRPEWCPIGEEPVAVGVAARKRNDP